MSVPDLALQLHALAMNMPCPDHESREGKPKDWMPPDRDQVMAYKEGHRDARHAIAEELASHEGVAALTAERDRYRAACKAALPEINCLYDQIPRRAKAKNEQTVDDLIASRPTASVARAVLALRAALAGGQGKGEGA